MLNINFLIKKTNKLLLSINNRIESFFNRLKNLINLKKKKKIKLKKIDNRITLGVGLLLLLIIVYFLIPAFYNKNLVKTKLENQILKKYNLEVNFEDELSYRLFPKPHFFSKKMTTTYDNSILAETSHSKIFVSIKNFFLLDKLKLEDLFFKKTKFNINSNNIEFFKEILNSNKSDHSINFKNSILFYKNNVEDVLVIIDINNLKLFYDEDLNQQLNANYNIYNIPFNLSIKNNLKNKKIFTKLKSHKIRLNINNSYDYNNVDKNGLVEIKIINKFKEFNYTVNKKSLSFNSTNNNFGGNLYFKPFYLSSNLNFNQLDIKKIFKDDSIFLNLFNSEILNNQNLNAKVNINFNKIKGVNYIKDIALKAYFEEGNINLQSSNLNWNDSIIMNLDDVQLFNQNNKFTMAGSIIFNFTDMDKFYSHYQVKRNYRKKIEKIKLDFLFNLNEKEIQLDNMKIDGDSSKIIDDFINSFNSKKINIFNKVLFKNSIKEFFAKYHEG
ncbi:hypothetical protein N9341_04785 [Candidatus Pelagibacter sp.]|nr:hypothetical protein [Candidatus Pelagibacter sp.]